MAHDDLLEFPVVAIPVVHPPKDWRYECRQQAQEIVGQLWLGPMSVVNDLKFMQQSARISAVLLLADPRLTSGIQRRCEGQFDVLCVSTFDVNEPLASRRGTLQVQHFRDAVGFICDKLGPDSSVLVCCESGNDKSAYAVAAYLMFKHRLSLAEAINNIQAVRYSISPSANDLYFLQAYESSVCDVRHVHQQPSSHKRTLDPDT